MPIAKAPTGSQPTRVPEPRVLGKPPNPRRPQLVRDVRGGALKDLFEVFPDLPRPPRPPARVRATRAAKVPRPPSRR
jgi:hypothetical protein